MLEVGLQLSFFKTAHYLTCGQHPSTHEHPCCIPFTEAHCHKELCHRSPNRSQKKSLSLSSQGKQFDQLESNSILAPTSNKSCKRVCRKLFMRASVCVHDSWGKQAPQYVRSPLVTHQSPFTPPNICVWNGLGWSLA